MEYSRFLRRLTSTTISGPWDRGGFFLIAIFRRFCISFPYRQVFRLLGLEEEPRTPLEVFLRQLWLTERLGPEGAYSITDQVHDNLIHKVFDYEVTVNEMTGDRPPGRGRCLFSLRPSRTRPLGRQLPEELSHARISWGRQHRR